MLAVPSLSALRVFMFFFGIPTFVEGSILTLRLVGLPF